MSIYNGGYLENNETELIEVRYSLGCLKKGKKIKCRLNCNTRKILYKKIKFIYLENIYFIKVLKNNEKATFLGKVYAVKKKKNSSKKIKFLNKIIKTCFMKGGIK